MSVGNSSDAGRYAFYGRMSDDKQENSIARQWGEVEPYAGRRGYRLVGKYIDEGIAGDEIDRREEFRRLLRDAQAGLFNVILCDDKDRFGRFDLIDQGEIIAPLRRAGVWLETVAQGKIDWLTFTGRITDAVLQEAKKMESQAISRRVLTGLLAKARAGEWPSALAPHGYRVERVDGKRRLVLGPPEEVRVVRFIFEAVACRHWTLSQVMEELRLRGVAPPTGNGHGRNKALGAWDRSTIRKMLRNRAYVGDIVYNNSRQGKHHECAGGVVRGFDMPERKKRKSAPADLVVRENTHEPLVSREIFAKADDALVRHRRLTTPAKRGPGFFVLTRFLVCSHCGHYMSGRLDHGRKYYGCTTPSRLGKHVCPGARVAEDVILPLVVKAIQGQFLNPDRLAQLRADVLAEAEAEKAAGGRIDGLRQRLAELKAQVEQGHRNLAILPADVLPGVVEQVRKLEAERDRVAAEVEGIASGRRQHEAAETLARVEQELWKLREAFEASDPAQVRAVFLDVVDRVELDFEHRAGARRNKHIFTGGTVYLRGEKDCADLGNWDNRTPTRRSSGHSPSRSAGTWPGRPGIRSGG
jgi:DNA invertase Pin-like site-specific DNA recombinase